MADYIVDGAHLESIANAIREKTNTTDGIRLADMGAKIKSINISNSTPTPEISAGTGGIIDVTELPTEDISESSFYRVTSETVNITEAKLIFGGEVAPYQTNCYPVDGLPETGELFIFETDDTLIMNFYYNTQNKEVHAYINDAMGADVGMSAGWLTAEEILTLMGMPWGGVITDMADAQADKAHLLLNITNGDVKYDLYLYKDGWMQLPFAYETAGSSGGIQWDGVVDDRLSLDFGDYQFVKISDTALSMDEILGATVTVNIPPEMMEVPGGKSTFVVSESLVDGEEAAGYMVFDEITEIPVLLCILDPAAMADMVPIEGLKVGLYSISLMGMVYVSQIESEYLSTSKIVKIDSKFIDGDIDIDLSEYAKISEVDEKINQAIGNAIGGSY